MERMILTGIILLLLAMPQAAAQEQFTVIAVDGKIEKTETGNLLQTGDRLGFRAPLRFYSPKARAAVISPKEGRMLLKPQHPDKLMAAAANFVPPISNMRTRSTPMLRSSHEMKMFFMGSIFLLDKMRVPVAPNAFPLDETHYFFLRYTSGSDTVRTKMATDRNQLILSRQEIFQAKGQSLPIPQEQDMVLFYSNGGQTEKMGAFKLVMPAEDKLQKEVAVLLRALADKPTGHKIEEIIAFIEDFYGKADPVAIDRWASKVFSL